MLTRLKVDGFKNLRDVDVRFGPFTCIAGPNGAGKSNLFDAINFLSLLADRPLMEAALSVRSERGRSSDLKSIFHCVGHQRAAEMRFEVEMLVPREGVDDLGQAARAATTFLRYGLLLGLEEDALTVREEALTHVTLSEAKRNLPFPHSKKWRDSVVQGRRAAPFISTDDKTGSRLVYLHLDQGEGYKGGGRPKPHVADRLPRTVLSTANSAESATAVLARREMQSWHMLQLEPSALRAPDPYNAPRSVAANGAHLPATLARLAGLAVRRTSNGSSSTADAASVYAEVANRLAELIAGVRSIRIDADDRRELFTLLLTDDTRTEHEARSLSDGTLRFLALAILERDPEATGSLCLEEPENGIHPERIPAMLQLLEDISVDSQEPVTPENPLRQVIVNTHSPAVVAQVSDGDLLIAEWEHALAGAHRYVKPVFRWLEGTWRATASPEAPTAAAGRIRSFMYPFRARSQTARPTRVADRLDLQMVLDLQAG